MDDLSEAFANVERAAVRVSGKIDAARTVTERDARCVMQQFELLRCRIRDTYGSIEAAPIAIRDAYEDAESFVKAATEKIRVLCDELSVTP